MVVSVLDRWPNEVLLCCELGGAFAYSPALRLEAMLARDHHYLRLQTDSFETFGDFLETPHFMIHKLQTRKIGLTYSS